MQIQQDRKWYSIDTKKEKDFENILKSEITAYETETVYEYGSRKSLLGRSSLR